MTNNQKLSLAIAVIVILLLIIFWTPILEWWKRLTGSKTDETKSAYDTCIDKNKSLSDGTECVNCVAEGSAQTSYNGVIKDGKCEPKQTLPDGASCTVKVNGVLVNGTVENGVCKPTVVTTQQNVIKITNPKGARTLIYNGTTFQSGMQANVIPFNSQVIAIQTIPSPHVYYKTQAGWIDGDDATKIS